MWFHNGPQGGSRLPALLPIINTFPVPSPNGLEDATNGIAPFIVTRSNLSSIDSTSIRLDRAANNKLRLFFRFTQTSSRVVTTEGSKLTRHHLMLALSNS